VTPVEERPEHRTAVLELHRAAFVGEAEAALIERLDRADLVVLSLVALEQTAPVGHILFSTLDVTVDGRAVAAVALAPLAVRPDRQRQGIGSSLIGSGLERLHGLGQAAVLVLGHPAYYPRFGFSAEGARHLDAPFRGEAFMALELAPGALAGRAGVVRYPAAWSPL